MEDGRRKPREHLHTGPIPELTQVSLGLELVDAGVPSTEHLGGEQQVIAPEAVGGLPRVTIAVELREGDIAAHRKPMGGVYRTGLATWLLARLLVRLPHRLLPNIIAEREIVPEFVPYLGGPARIVRQVSRILLDSKHGAVQAEELHRVCLRFANHDPAAEAARAIVELVREDARGP